MASLSIENHELDLVEQTASRVQKLISDTDLMPGQQLREEALAAELGVSRNTLREAFRILIRAGLLVREPYRGVFVASPSLADVVDIFGVRRIVEEGALRSAIPHHPGVADVRAAVDAAVVHRDAEEWRSVGAMNMAFHAAIVALAENSRLNALFARVQAEMGLVFAQIVLPERVHAPFVEENLALADLIGAGEFQAAADRLDVYFDRSQRMVLAAIEQR